MQNCIEVFPYTIYGYDKEIISIMVVAPLFGNFMYRQEGDTSK